MQWPSADSSWRIKRYGVAISNWRSEQHGNDISMAARKRQIVISAATSMA